MTTQKRFAPDDDEARIAALAQRLMHGDFSELSSREKRVIATIARRQPASRNANHAIEEDASFGEHLADSVARFGGSWTFIVTFVLGLAGWIGINVVMLSKYGTAFDAYPFIFLNLILSRWLPFRRP